MNFSDVKRRRGDAYPFETTFPFVPGGEIAGTVVAHGPGVTAPAVGEAVFALAGDNGFGGYAQYAVAYATTTAPVPPGVGFDGAATFLIAGSTALIMLTEAARLAVGETILIPAATGGVGSFAVQIARMLEAGKVIAAVGDAKKREAALALGAHEVIVASDAAWPARVRTLTGGRGVDVALEATGGDNLEATLGCLAPFGRAVVFGAASGRSASLSAAALDRLLYAPAPNQSVLGFNIGGWFLERPAVAGPALGRLVGDVLKQRIRLPALRALPLADAKMAHELLEAREVSGKLILKPWS